LDCLQSFGGGIMRIKIIKPTKKYYKGEIVEVSKNVAFGLIDSGVGIISKDMTSYEVKTRNKK